MMKKGTHLSEALLHALPRSVDLVLLLQILPHLLGLHLIIEVHVAYVAQQLETVKIITK